MLCQPFADGRGWWLRLIVMNDLSREEFELMDAYLGAANFALGQLK